MRLNQYLARAGGFSRRQADKFISAGRVKINNQLAELGQGVQDSDIITLDNKPLILKTTSVIILNKPVGYVCSRRGQGAKTIYELIPPELHHLNSVGRLDKNSSGLLLLTNDGTLANQLTHPRYKKLKIYQVELDKPINHNDINNLLKGVNLDDGLSKFTSAKDISSKQLQVGLAEGKNRQVRRTFEKLGYGVISLHRTQFGPYKLAELKTGHYKHL